jgi:hypothetical protein
MSVVKRYTSGMHSGFYNQVETQEREALLLIPAMRE